MTCTCNRSLHIKGSLQYFSILFFVLIHFPLSFSLYIFTVFSLSSFFLKAIETLGFSDPQASDLGLAFSVKSSSLRSDCFSCSWLEIRAKHRRNWFWFGFRFGFLIRRCCSASHLQVSFLTVVSRCFCNSCFVWWSVWLLRNGARKVLVLNLWFFYSFLWLGEEERYKPNVYGFQVKLGLGFLLFLAIGWNMDCTPRVYGVQTLAKIQKYSFVCFTLQSMLFLALLEVLDVISISLIELWRFVHVL